VVLGRKEGAVGGLPLFPSLSTWGREERERRKKNVCLAVL
jgi:hypothetical protein